MFSCLKLQQQHETLQLLSKTVLSCCESSVWIGRKHTTHYFSMCPSGFPDVEAIMQRLLLMADVQQQTHTHTHKKHIVQMLHIAIDTKPSSPTSPCKTTFIHANSFLYSLPLPISSMLACLSSKPSYIPVTFPCGNTHILGRFSR